MPRDYSKLPTPLRRDGKSTHRINDSKTRVKTYPFFSHLVSSDPTKDLKLSTNLLNKDQKDDTNKPPSTPTSSEPPPPPSSSSSYAPSNRYNNEWRDTERDRERHRRYREEDRRRDYDRRRDG